MTTRLPVKVVVFDLGFTLWNEEAAWLDWARWLKVPASEFLAVLGSVIERGEHHHRVFQIVRPGIDIDRERELRKGAGIADIFRPEDLYDDAIPCLTELRKRGFRVGVAGNHLADCGEVLRHRNAVDFVGSSEEWGVEKPSPDFFSRLVQVCGVRPEEIAYVGDRLDNDVLPAKKAGMVSVFLRRGPWGMIHGRRPEAAQADLCIESLSGLCRGLQDRNEALTASSPR